MGVKKINTIHLLNAVAISSTNTVTSATVDIHNIDNCGLQVVFTGTPTGTLTVNCAQDTTLTPIALTFNPVLTQPTGAPLSYLINLNQLPFNYVNVSYTNSSGSGTLDVWLSEKDVN